MSTPPADHETVGEARELAADILDGPYPFEASILREVNDGSTLAALAARFVHAAPPGSQAWESTRPVWVAGWFRTAEGERLILDGWCWFASERAGQTAIDAYPGTATLHETPVPRTMRSGDVEAHLARFFRAPAADPT